MYFVEYNNVCYYFLENPLGSCWFWWPSCLCSPNYVAAIILLVSQILCSWIWLTVYFIIIVVYSFSFLFVIEGCKHPNKRKNHPFCKKKRTQVSQKFCNTWITYLLYSSSYNKSYLAFQVEAIMLHCLKPPFCQFFDSILILFLILQGEKNTFSEAFISFWLLKNSECRKWTMDQNK